MKKGIFFDKDGTLVENIPYNVDPFKIRLLPYAIEGLKMLSTAGYELVLITNQPGIARGLFTELDLTRVETRIRQVLGEAGIRLADFSYCPHLPGGELARYGIDCDCRKPLPGLIRKAAADLDIDLDRSWCVGDILNDVEAGNAAGCKSILIDNGSETLWELNRLRLPDHVVSNLVEAAGVITAADATAEFLARTGHTHKQRKNAK